MRFLALLVLSVVTIPSLAELSVFAQAQQAATEGRYDDVIAVLSTAIDDESTSEEDLAIAYSNRGIAYSLMQRYGLAVQDLQQAYRLNPRHPLTLNHLGILAEHVERDFAAAAGWYNRAASLGYAASEVNLGNLFRHGLGVEQDYGRAVKLYELAVQQNYDAGLVALGEMYIDGAGVAQDPVRGFRLLDEGVKRGVVTGNFYLGRIYEKGIGVEVDFEAALGHYREAAVQGHAASQGALGYMYRSGQGVKKDFIEAVKWYRLASEQGDVLAANRLAWLLAGCPIKEVCNGEVALEFAGLAVQSERSATNLDSLAAAYARVGEFDRALQVVNEIMAFDDLSESSRRKYQRRIDRYRNGIPFQL